MLAGLCITNLTNRFTFFYEDKTFAERAAEKNGGFIVGGDNYGQGSSREHAALGPWQFGIKAVFAKTYARIHRANLINVGIIPFLCDTDAIDQGDELEIGVSNLEGDLVVQNKTEGTQFSVVHDLSKHEIDTIRAGGLFAYTAQRHG